MPTKEGGNPLGFGTIVMTQAIGTAMAYGLTQFGVEGRLQSAGLAVDARTAQLALVGGVSLAMGFLASLVNKARADYDVPWPHLMLPKSDKHAVAYNAVQRSHANYGEAALVMVPITLVTADMAPATVFALSQLWCWGKFGMSYLYATSQDTKSRFSMAWSYVPYFALHGYVWIGLLA